MSTMGKSVAYAYLKTIDGEEVMEYSKEQFDNLLKTIKFRTIEKSDRTLYFIADNVKLNGVNYYKDDYFEIVK
jgi:hypothetical protein